MLSTGFLGGAYRSN